MTERRLGAGGGNPRGQRHGTGKERPASRSQVVARHVLAKLSSGELKPGDKLPSETELMDLLDVGRSSIREALSGLSLMGMLQMKRRGGTVVLAQGLGGLSDELRQRSKYWLIRDLEEVRILLEGFAAGRAAELADEKALAEIWEAGGKVEAKAKKKQSYFKENALFHLAIAKAARNSALVFCLSSIIERFQGARESLNWTPIVRERDVGEHRQIYQAIRDHQSDLARALMEAHLNRNITRLEKPEQE